MIRTYLCSGTVNIFDRHMEGMEDINIPTRRYSMNCKSNQP